MINTNRNLTTIATEILARTQSIADVIEIGALLIEAQDHLEHGEWLPWVEHELDFSERSAQNYMAAHRFALKYATIADLKLTLGALYELASGNYYSDDEIGAVLAIAATERVTRERLDEIIEALTPKEDDEPSEEDDEEERRQWEAELAAANEAKEARAKEAAEAAAILDGPPPELPTTEEAPVVDHLTPAFTQAVEKLRELSTKPLAKFKDLAAMPEVVAAAEFLQNVVGHGGGGLQPIITAEQRLAQYAADERYEELKDQLGDVFGKFMWKWEASDLKAIYDSATNKERDQIEEMIYERHPEPKKNRARKTTQYEIEDGVPLPQGDVRP